MDAMKLSKLAPESVASPDTVKSLWTVKTSDTEIGYLASTVKTYTSPSTGKKSFPVRWGFAVNKDEFRSGIQFIYDSRKVALAQLVQSVKN